MSTTGVAARRVVAVNIGNTNLSTAAFEGGKVVWARRAPVERAEEAAVALARKKDASDVVVASVNPACTRRFTAAYRRAARRPVLVIGKEVPVPIVNLTEEPERVGADRLLNALAAFRRCNGAALVVDAGTAITFDLVSRKGEFLGGLIAPGMRIAALALAEHTALLPKVQVKRPRNLIGRNTEEAIRAGVFWGAVGMITGVVALLRNRLGEGAALFLTGGSAMQIAPHLPEAFIHVPHLTLEGIVWAYEACRGGKRSDTLSGG